MSGTYTFRRPKRRPEPTTRLTVALVVAIVLLLLGCGLGLRAAFAQEVDELAAAVWATPTPTEVPRYTPPSRSGRPAVARWAPLLERYDWDVDQALAVVECESKGDPTAVNRWSGATGLFQTMPSWRSLARFLTGSGDLTDPATNVAVAYYLWADSGGTFRWHWAASWGCWL